MPNAALHQAHEGVAGLQLEKTDKRVNYRIASEGDNPCGDCRYFCEGGMHCNLVEGSIDAEWTCNLWTKEMSGQANSVPSYIGYAERTDDFAILYKIDETKAFKDADLSKPMWIPYLPTPGVYKHPVYGEIELTEERIKTFVQSVTDKVYQEQIPIDAEHETKLSGAVGWLSKMRTNEDGSADGLVTWTARGQDLLKGGQFKYFSPEWFNKWRDPATGTVHDDVIAGGAITTRPFFKDKVLRALVASEDGGEVIAPDSEGDQRMAGEDKDKGKAAEPTTITMTEVQLDEKIKKATEAASAAVETKFTEKIGELETKLSAAETTAASEKELREAATTKLAAQEKADRERRFRDMISGKGGANDGAPWVGDADKHLAVVTKMAETFGEADEAFTSHVENQAAIANQAKESNLFSPVGHGAQASTRMGDNKLDELARAKMTEAPQLSYEQAMARVMETAAGKQAYAERGKVYTEPPKGQN